MSKKIITCCDKCGKHVTGKQALTVAYHALHDVDGKPLFMQPGYAESMRTRSEMKAEITICRTCILSLLEEPRVTRRSVENPTKNKDPLAGMTPNEIHNAYGDPGPGEWEPTEENGGRGGPGDR